MAEKEKYRAQLAASGDTDTMQYLDDLGFVVNFIYAALHGDETHAVDYYQAFADDPELKSLCGGIDLTRYDRLLEAKLKREQQANNRTNGEATSSGNSSGGIYLRRADAER